MVDGGWWFFEKLWSADMGANRTYQSVKEERSEKGGERVMAAPRGLKAGPGVMRPPTPAWVTLELTSVMGLLYI